MVRREQHHTDDTDDKSRDGDDESDQEVGEQKSLFFFLDFARSFSQALRLDNTCSEDRGIDGGKGHNERSDSIGCPRGIGDCGDVGRGGERREREDGD